VESVSPLPLCSTEWKTSLPPSGVPHASPAHSFPASTVRQEKALPPLLPEEFLPSSLLLLFFAGSSRRSKSCFPSYPACVKTFRFFSLLSVQFKASLLLPLLRGTPWPSLSLRVERSRHAFFFFLSFVIEMKEENPVTCLFSTL